MSDFDWVFDPPPPSGARSGGNPALYVFDADHQTFVREVLQNALDQRHQDDRVATTLVLEDLDGEDLQSALAALNWPALRSHLQGVAKGDSLVAGSVEKALEWVGKGSLRIMRIDDSGTVGLRGDEDDSTGNFAALCKNTLVTSEEKGLRGGSYGLGKAVLWRFSRLRTVLFVSDVAGPEGLVRRTFGRTEVPFHDAGGAPWSGPGFFGHSDKTPAGTRARSVYTTVDAGPFAGTALDRPTTIGMGTSLVLLDFQPPDFDEPPELEILSEQLLASAGEFFWPAIAGDSLDFAVRHHGATQPCELSGPEALFASLDDSDGEVMTKSFKVRVPSRPDDAADPVGTGVVLIKSGINPLDAGHLLNRVALQRGTGMVLSYWDPKVPLVEQPFVGVALLGEAAGTTPEDEAVEEFLRAAEPPAHHEWVHTTDRVRSLYRQGAGARLKDLWAALSDAIAQCVQAPQEPTDEGPQRLRRLFKIGGPPPPPAARFAVNFDSHERRVGGWTITGRVDRIKESERAWQVEIRLSLDAEAGRGDTVLPSALVTNPSLAVTESDDRNRISVPSDMNSLGFTIEADDPDGAVAGRAILRVDVNPEEKTVHVDG